MRPVISTAVALGASSISCTPSVRLFQCAVTRERRIPGGRERAAIPSDVSVNTADPGSSAMTLPYRAGHLERS